LSTGYLRGRLTTESAALFQEEGIQGRGNIMRLMLACMVVVMMFVSADAAYGLGGGGHGGDGRQDFSPQGGHDSVTGGDTPAQIIPEAIAALPEPIALLLLGLGVVGLAGLTRKLRSYR
jgi:hypothetical protein